MSRHRLLLILSLWLAFGLRVWGLDFGLPYDFHADENYYIEPVLNGLIMDTISSELTPSLFTRLPFKYILLVGLWGWLKIAPYTASEQWLTVTWYFARYWSVVFGVLNVALVYPVGKRLYGKQAGLMATMLMAGLFLAVRESHFAVNDAMTAFVILLGLYLCLLLFWRRRWYDFLLVGVVLGVAAMTKLTGWFTFVGLAAAYLLTFVQTGKPLKGDGTLSNRLQEIKYLGLTAVIISGLFLTASVRSFAGLGQFFIRLVNFFLSAPFYYTSNFKDIKMAPFSGWQFYLYVLGWGAGWVLVSLSIVGLVLVFWRKYRPGIVLAVFSVVFFWYIGGRNFLFARFVLPVLAPLTTLTVGELNSLSLFQSMRTRSRILLSITLLALMFAQPLSASIWFDYLLTLPDTRLQASEWLLKQFPPDTVIVKEAYAVFPKTVFMDKRWQFPEIQLNERGPERNSIDYYVRHKTDLIVTSNFVSGRARANQTEEAVRLAQQSILEEQAQLIKVFNPYRQSIDTERWFYLDEIYGPAGELFLRRQPGPLLKIYRLPYENQPRNLEVPPITTPVQANFADRIMLLGYDLPSRRVEPGGVLPITLYWQALSRIEANLLVFNHLLDSQQRQWGGYDRWPQETSKTTLWHPGEVVIDTFSIPVNEDAPNGIYWLQIGLYLPLEDHAVYLPLFQDGHPVDATSITIGPIKVGGPPPGVTVTQARPEHAVNATFGNQITLQGYDMSISNPQSPISNRQSSIVNLKLYWQALRPPDADYTLFVHIRNAAGEVVAQRDQPVAGGRYPSSLWEPGEQVFDRVEIPLPDDLPPGRYEVVVGLYELATGQRLAVPGSADNSLLLAEFENR